MNLQHLYYALEVERTGSITQAAENLYMGQPNLSRAIRELETSLGMPIFRRSSKGIVPTDKGKQFLRYAQHIIEQVEEAESLFRPDGPEALRCRVAATHTSSFAEDFCRFAAEIQKSEEYRGFELEYRETSAWNAADLVADGVCAMAVVRISCDETGYAHSLKEKGLQSEFLGNVHEELVFAKKHPLAKHKVINKADLAAYTEVCYGEGSVRGMAPAAKMRDLDNVKKIMIMDRASCFRLLESIPGSYAWLPPEPQKDLERYGLVQRPCEDVEHISQDLLLLPDDGISWPLAQTFAERLKAHMTQTK